MAFLGIPLVFSMFIMIIGIIIIWAITKFVLYIFQSFGLWHIAKKEQYRYPYIVWIPGISHYILGKFSLTTKKAITYCVFTIIKLILFVCFVFIDNEILFYSFLIYLVLYFIIDMLVMNQFYKKVYKNSEVFTITTVITLGLLKPIFIYTARIKKITKYEL